MQIHRLGVRAAAMAAAIGAGCLPVTAFAGQCEDGFIKQGSFVSGLKFTASMAQGDLTPASAIAQLSAIAKSRGYDVLAEEPDEGSMLIEQPQSGKTRAFPIIVSVSPGGGGVAVVRMEARLRAAMQVPTDAARAEMCGMLNQIRGGKEGLAVARAAAAAAAPPGPPLAISALGLSQQISKDAERNAAAIPLRYKGKSFTVSGTVDYVIRDGEYYRIAYAIPNPWELALQAPNQAKFKTDISCLMAKGQAALALTLKPGKSIKFTGTFRDHDEFKRVMWLENCRPAQ